MTFCVAVSVREGIVALADTRISKGSEILNKGKLSTHIVGEQSFFTMTSGLRSIRDKAVTYLDEALSMFEARPSRLYQIANSLGTQLRRVRQEDGAELARSNLHFNLHAIVGGALPGDAKPALYLVYPEGNWIEVSEDSPFFVIGRTGIGSALLHRNVHYDTPLREAALWATVAFDLTASFASDVDYPFDLAVMVADAPAFQRRRFDRPDVAPTLSAFHASMAALMKSAPADWLTPLVSEKPKD